MDSGDTTETYHEDSSFDYTVVDGNSFFDFSLDEVEERQGELEPFLLHRNDAQAPIAVQPPLAPPLGTVIALPALRIQAKEFALTFPQTDVVPEEALRRILASVELQAVGIEMCLVVQEAHTIVVESTHLHIWILLGRALRVRNHQFFDFIADKHGNYQRVRSRSKWLNYLMKAPLAASHYPADLDLIDYMSSLDSKKSSKSTVISQAIKRGTRNIHVLVDQEPGFVMMNQHKVRDFINLCNDFDAVNVVHILFPIVFPADLLPLSESSNEIYQWVKESVCEPFTRAKVHLRIIGDSGIHKTHLFTLLSSFFHVWHAPYDDLQWMERFDDRHHELVLFDEYKSQYPIRKLNEFCDGSGYGCPQRNQLPFIHTIYTPCLMATNYSWIEAYPKALGQDAIALRTVSRRWKEVTVPFGEDLLVLCLWLETYL